MNTDSIFTAMQQLHEVAGDGPATRKSLDTLFRHVHNLKANASANGLSDLASAAHEFENVLHSMRTAAADTSLTNSIPADIWSSLRQDQKSTLTQSIAEGAKLFLVEASFDLAHFDREFQNLEQTLNKTGEVICRLPNASPGKVNFRILYAQRDETADLPNSSEITIEQISAVLTNAAKATNDLKTVERAFEKFSAALINLPAASDEGVLQQILRAGRAAAAVTGKEVEFEIRGEDLLLAKTYVDPLLHLVRNAVDHGIEASEERVKLGKPERGKISIEAATLDGETRITVTDDGRGIDPTLIERIFRPGFSTATQVSEVSGRGVGLDIVQTTVKELGGTISITSQVGQGSTFEIKLPK